MPAGSVGAERCPPGTCAPIGGGETWLSLWESWHDVVVTERAAFQGGSQRGRQRRLACRLGRWSPVATVQRRPKRELRPVAGRVPPARSDPFGTPPRYFILCLKEGCLPWGYKSSPLSHDCVVPAPPRGEPSKPTPGSPAGEKPGGAHPPTPLPRPDPGDICTLGGAGGGNKFLN